MVLLLLDLVEMLVLGLVAHAHELGDLLFQDLVLFIEFLDSLIFQFYLRTVLALSEAHHLHLGPSVDVLLLQMAEPGHLLVLLEELFLHSLERLDLALESNELLGLEPQLLLQLLVL